MYPNVKEWRCGVGRNKGGWFYEKERKRDKECESEKRMKNGNNGNISTHFEDNDNNDNDNGINKIYKKCQHNARNFLRKHTLHIL